MKLVKKWWLVAGFLAIVLIIGWEEVRCQTQADQCRASYTAQAQSERSPGNVPINQQASEQQAIAAACEPNGYFCRLFGAANLPTVLLVFIGIGGVWAGLETLTAIKRELVLTQRPRISVQNFYFSEMRGVGGVYNTPSGIQNGSFCTGQFYIRNVGGSRARIEEIYCDIWAEEEQGKLPMKCPYEGKIGKEGKWEILPGQSMTWLFGRTEPLTDDVGMKRIMGRNSVYVLGWIGYRDDLGTYRSMRFCRQYTPSKDRFLAVDDKDYEYAD
jgi:hypothetical protein